MTIANEPPEDRFCDLVMKGGITSGVVYPNAIEILSRQYRFKNIGGTSAGAIAAAVTAAAEFNRRTNGSRDGFDLLKTLPEQLKTEIAPGRRKLVSLFQPQTATRRLFFVLVNALNCKDTISRIGSIAFGLLRAYWFATIASVSVTATVGWLGGDWLALALTLLVTLVVMIVTSIYWDVTRRVVENGFGLCTGLTEDSKHEALTPWLHSLIQRAAGLAEHGKPLTFGDLWDAPGFPVGHFSVQKGAVCKSINLEMFATNLSHGRPYIFPLLDRALDENKLRASDRLFFNRQEMSRYLPTEILNWLTEKGREYHCEPSRHGRDPSDEDARKLGLLEIPEARNFPVVLAARLSLSFPFLFSAVPFWTINHEVQGQAVFRRCWFSDGGICSNFPMHLFDGLVPAWPTFGINLEPQIKGRDDVYLPKQYAEGHGERWDNFDEANNLASRFGGFVSAIVNTMQNWNDNALSRTPGVRDRVARVRLSPDEGGLNLNMEAHIIEAVADRGSRAASHIVEQFAVHGPEVKSSRGWDDQRWIRLGVLLKLIEERAAGVAMALDPKCPHASSFLELIDRAGNPESGVPAGFEAPLSPEQQSAFRAALVALSAFTRALSAPTGEGHANQEGVLQPTIGFKPIPKSELRVRPPL